MTATCRIPRLGLVATVLLALFGCSSESSEETRDDGAPTTGDTAPPTSPGPTTSAPGEQPPLTELEATIVEALGGLGIDAQRAELPGPTSASLWAELDGGSELVVNASDPGQSGDWTVVDERTVNGVTVQRIEYIGGRVTDQFECSGVRYTADGAVPPGFADFDEFLADFVAALGCTGA